MTQQQSANGTARGSGIDIRGHAPISEGPLNLHGVGLTPVTYGTGYASQNRALLQGALDRGGEIEFLDPGTFEIDYTLFVDSYTRLVLGPRTELKMNRQAGQGLPLMMNRQMQIAPITISAGNLTSVGKTVTCVTDTPHGLLVGDYAVLYNIATAGYAGVFHVESVANPTTFTYLAFESPAASPAVASAHAGLTTMSVKKCDVEIHLEGGIWNYNASQVISGAPTPFYAWLPSNINTHELIFWGVFSSSLRRLRVLDTVKYNIYYSGARAVRVQDISVNSLSDCVHFSGCCSDFVVDGLHGDTDDNMIGFGTADFSTYQLCLGPCDSISIRNVHSEYGSGVRMFGEDENYISNVVIENITGIVATPSAAVQIQDDPGVYGGLTKIKGVTIRNVRAYTQGTHLITVQCRAGSEDLTIEDCEQLSNEVNNNGVSFTNGGNPIVLERAIIRNLRGRSTSTHAFALVYAAPGADIDQLIIENSYLESSGASFGKFVLVSGTVENLIMSGNRITAGNAFVQVDAAGVVNRATMFGNYVGCAYGLNYVSTTPITVDAVGNLFATTLGTWRDASASGKITVNSAGNVYPATPFARTAAQTFTVNGFDLKIEPITFADAVLGSYAFSTQSGVENGPCIYGPAGWVALGTGAGGINSVIT